MDADTRGTRLPVPEAGSLTIVNAAEAGDSDAWRARLGESIMSALTLEPHQKARKRRIAPKAAALLAALAIAPSGAFAEQDLIGSDEYAAACLSCHGVGGRGDGPMAEFLTVEPTDLTTISKENDGVFPLLEVFQVIDGRTVVGAHGVRETGGWEMPVWGARYEEQAGSKYGPYGSEAAVRARILELVYYIQSIQQL